MNREMDQKIELLPCPFCGGEAELGEQFDPQFVFVVRCKAIIGCHATSGVWSRTSDAIAAWNRRAPQQPAEPRRKCGTLLMVRVPPQPYEKPMGECWLDAGHEGEHDFNPPMQNTVTVIGQNLEPAKDEERKRS